MRITKVKITKYNQVSITWLQGSHNQDEYSFSCSENARPEFYTALESLAEHVIEMCELPLEYLERITVKGVSFSYGGDSETMGAVISASMSLNNSHQALNLVTPHKASEMYCPDTPEDEMQLLSDDCIDALRNLIEECELYISGDRAQMNLFAKEAV